MGKPDQNAGTLRIVAGQWRSRRIEFPDAPGLRPTSDRIRETLFNWLQGDVRGAVCLDLFAGSGALGIEALSRGARAVDFVESNTEAAAALARNLEKLDQDAGCVYRDVVSNWIEQNGRSRSRYDLVFIDPPYADRSLPSVCRQLEDSGLLRAQVRIYLEDNQPVDANAIPANWKPLREKRAGQVYYYLFEKNADSM